MKLTSTLLFPLTLLSGAFASDDAENATNADTKVAVLTTDSFDDYIKHDSLVLVKFYAPWCGHCKSMAPAYDKASITLAEKNIKLGKVDCTVETELCNKYDVQGFPTLKIFSDGDNSEYNGGRDEDAIVSTMIRKSLPAVSELTSENFDEFSTSEKVVVIGYFDDAESDEYKVFEKAAKNLNDDYTFGAVVDSKLAKKHKVKVPAVVVHKKFDEPTADVEYNEDHKALVKDIKSAATPLIGDIGPQNYASYVESKLPLAYIFIETEEHREEFEPIFKPIAKEHKGDINFVFINATMFGRQAEVINLEQKFPAFGIQQLEPAAKFPFDQSNDLTEKAVAKFVKEFAAGKLEPSVKSEAIPEGKDGNTTVLVAKNFVDVVLDKTKDVLVEFYAPWCGHCKRLAPIYDELAALYPEDSNVVVAKFDAIANDIPVGVDVEVQGFPTIKLFKAKDNKVIDFEGERTVEGFVNFLNDNADSKFEPELPASEDESEEKEDAEEEEL